MADATGILYAPAISVEGKGVIYRMIDEFDNDVPYDFKNILFTGSSYDGSVNYANAYTFSYTEDSTIKDASLLASKNCYSNVINEGSSSGKQQLNFNVFYSTNTTFGCYGNTFGSSCYKNTFGNGCDDNTFDNSCSYNTFGYSCSKNTFGTSCSQNTFGTVCFQNTFGHGFSDNTLGGGFSTNTFGNQYTDSTFGYNCSDNTFGNHGYNVALGDYCKNNKFGDYCCYVTFGDSSSTVNYCQYIIIDNGCQYLYINSTDTSASTSNYLQNVHVHLGVSGSSSSNRKTLTVADRNLAYETNFIVDGTSDIIV